MKLKHLISISLISLAASSFAHAEKLKVVTSFTVIADIASNVAGDAATVESLTKPGAEIHNYQPTPSDILRAQGADLVLWNGLNLERWYEKFFHHIQDVPSVTVTEGITPLLIESGPYSGKPNPHAWMSPNDVQVYIKNIENALIKHDPENADIYRANAKKYSSEVSSVLDSAKSIIADLPENRRWLVSSEGAFTYLARDLGLKEAYLWPINADQQGTPQQVRALIDLVNEQRVPVVFSESTVPAAPAQQVATETGAKYGGVLYVDSLSRADGPVPNYLSLLSVTTDTVLKGIAQ